MNHHTTAQSTALLTLINQLTGIEFEDSSYSSDACDSISSDKYKLQIFLPNVINPFIAKGDEDFDCFAVSYNDPEKDINGTYLDKQFNLFELVYFLNTLDWRFDIDGHTEVTLNEMITNHKEFTKQDELNFEELVLPYMDMEVEDQHLFPNELGGQITVTRIANNK